MSARARWAGFGFASATSLRRYAYHSQTRRGLRRNARGVASSSGLNFDHRPVWASRKVGRPLSADTPAPVSTTTRLALLSRSINFGGRATYSILAQPEFKRTENQRTISQNGEFKKL